MPAKVSFDLLDKVAMAEQLIVVDAIHSGEVPGTCTVADVTEIPASVASSECAHRAGVAQVLDFVRYVACDGPPRRVAIAAIEGKEFLRCGTTFSEDVWAAIPRVVDLILLYVGAAVQARIAVKDVCRHLREAASLSDEGWCGPHGGHELLAM